jgi:hypothetical protein
MTLLGLIFEPYKGQFKEEMKTKGSEGEKDENIFDNLYETRPQMNVDKEIHQTIENDSGTKFITNL